jgi:hypothetical protein
MWRGTPVAPRCAQSHGVSEYTLEEIIDMKAWHANKVSDRIRDATNTREEPNGIYLLVLHPGEDQPEEFQTIYQHQEPAYIMDAMTNLVVLAEIVEPSWLLMINRVEAIIYDPQKVRRLQEYGPLAMHLINCLMSVMDVSKEQSLNMMLMTCMSKNMKEMHERDARSPASMVISLKMTSSEFLADVVRLGLTKGSLQVKIGDLCGAMEAVGCMTRSQL